MSNLSHERVSTTGRTDSQIRDLCLVLFGFALCKAERQRVLDSVPRSMLTKEFLALFDAIRDQKADPVYTWFVNRGALLGTGKDCIQAAIDSLNSEAQHKKVLRILGQINFDKDTHDPTELANRLREYALMLEGKLEVPEVKL